MINQIPNRDLIKYIDIFPTSRGGVQFEVSSVNGREFEYELFPGCNKHAKVLLDYNDGTRPEQEIKVFLVDVMGGEFVNVIKWLTRRVHTPKTSNASCQFKSGSRNDSLSLKWERKQMLKA